MRNYYISDMGPKHKQLKYSAINDITVKKTFNFTKTLHLSTNIDSLKSAEKSENTVFVFTKTTEN